MQEWPIQTKFKRSFPHLELPIFLIFEQPYSVCLHASKKEDWQSWKLHVSSMFLCVFTPVERGQC